VNGRGVVTQMAAAPTQMAIGVPEGVYKCIDKYHRCTDTWCNDNCNHAGAAFCPASYCRKIATGSPPSTAPGSCPTGGLEGKIAQLFGGGKVCCPKTCGTCGGKGCASRPGGPNNCCVGAGKKTYGITGIGRSCATHAPPCMIPL
jgi:hypothetical protein